MRVDARGGRREARSGTGAAPGELELDERPDYQRPQWKVDRAAPVALYALILAALAGLLGAGPLSAGSAAAPGVALDYARFLRSGAPTELRVRMDADRAVGGEHRVEVDRRYLEQSRTERVTPEPAAVEAGLAALVFVFAQAAPDASLQATFQLTPQGLWRQHGRVGEVTFTQFVYP
ncbi:MAG: hypothetical protein ACKVWR_15735 [Acidimicrobiales bacterium]